MGTLRKKEREMESFITDAGIDWDATKVVLASLGSHPSKVVSRAPTTHVVMGQGPHISPEGVLPRPPLWCGMRIQAESIDFQEKPRY